jgi:hypothetical protein
MKMKCAKARKFISDYIDGDLDAGKVSSLEKHLDACPGCQELLKDFKLIKQRAKDLAKTEPSNQAWFRIRSRLEEKAKTSLPEPRVRFLFLPAKLRYAVSAALLLVAVTGAVIVGSRMWNRAGTQGEIKGQELALMKIQEAEQYYRLAIKALWEAAQAQKGNIDPKVAETFRINLELIDASLEDCRNAVARDPRNLESQYYLLAVYKKKAELLDSMIEVSSTAPQNKETKTTY